VELRVRPEELRLLATTLEQTRARLSRVEGEAGSAAHDLGHELLEAEMRGFGRAWTDGLAAIDEQLLGCVHGLRVAAQAYADADDALARSLADAQAQ
jgi:hypothetical protein